MPSTDPVQMLIDAGAIPQHPFDEHSRYRQVAIALLPAPALSPTSGPLRPPVPYLRRRFIAQPSDIALAAHATVGASERPDLLATRTLGEPLAYWRVADANGVFDPNTLTDTPGARVAIPVISG
jgi:hypothetical protein